MMSQSKQGGGHKKARSYNVIISKKIRIFLFDMNKGKGENDGEKYVESFNCKHSWQCH